MAKPRSRPKNMKQAQPVCCDPQHYHYYKGKKKAMIGLMLFVFGLIMYMGYMWYEALMAVGALMFLKGLWYMMKKG